jgi:hypothetical protein
MENNHVIFALKRKRAELAGLISDAEKRLDSLRQAIEGVDTTLRLFDPLADPADIKPKRIYKRRHPGFARNELSRLVMSALREAPEPVSARAIAASVTSAKGIESDDATIAKRVGNVLNALRKRGVAVKAGENGGATLWGKAA